MIQSRILQVALGLFISFGVYGMVDARNPMHVGSQWPELDRWVYLGQASVDGRADRDRIFVGRGLGRFRRIQIRVENAPIEFHRVIVHYSNGSREDLSVRQRIPAGGQTRAIDLRGDNRSIESVEFWYARGRQWGWQRPKVRLFGI